MKSIGENVVRIEAEALRALADRLRALACDPSLRQTFGCRGRLRIEEEFSSARNLDRLLAAFTAHQDP